MQQANATLMCRPILENEIRAALLRHLSDNQLSGSVIYEEFRIERGTSRIDIAVIGSKMLGYEIKSDLDSFKRLSNQIHAYNRVFDEISLVCGPSHATLAKETIPSWWGLSVAQSCGDGHIAIEIAREAKPNPKQDPFSLASLLWKDEALAVLASELFDTPKRASSHALWEDMSKLIPLERIRKIVIQSIIKRSSHNDLLVRTI